MNKIIAFVVVIALLGAGYYLYTNRADTVTNTDAGNVNQNPDMRTYSSDVYGITFQYPDSYVLTEQDAEGSGLRTHHTVTLVDATDATNVPTNGEGPVSITFSFFQNDLDGQAVENWIKNASNSNYKLAVSESLQPGSIDGVATLGYTWDGLYRGDSVVFAHNDRIVMASVTYMSPEDKIRTDFTQIIATIDLR